MFKRLKHTIVILLALILCLALCGCSGNADAPEITNAPINSTATLSTVASEATSEPVETLALGETASTNVIEFTLDNFQFADKLSSDADENYLTPIDEHAHITRVPKDGNAFACFSFTIKNIGKEKLSTLAYSNIKLVYSDGYTFEIDPNNNIVRTDDRIYTIYQKTGFLSIDVLAEAQTYRGYFEVPTKVLENAESPLVFIIQLQQGEQSIGFGSEIYSEFVYELRP